MKTKMIQRTILLLAVCAFVNPVHAASSSAAEAAAPTGADPYAKGSPTAPKAQAPDGPAVLTLCYEVFSLPLEQAASFQREQIFDGELYKRLVAGLKQGTVKQDIFTNLRVRSGEKAATEAILEQIYPTEYESPKFPNSMSLDFAATPADAKENAPPAVDPARSAALPTEAANDGMIAPALPRAFETRNTGESFEVEPILSADHKWIVLRLLPEQVLLVGETKHGQGLSEVSMPVFETRRTRTSVTVPVGKPFLLGTLNRPSMSKIDSDSAKRVSYAFVIAAIVNP